MTKIKLTRALTLVLAVTMLLGTLQIGLNVSADSSVLTVTVPSEYLAPDSGTGKTASDPIKIIRTIPTQLSMECLDSTYSSSTNTYIFDAAQKDPEIGSTDFTGYSDYAKFSKKVIPSYYGTRSQKLVEDGWGESLTAYATASKPMDKTYVAAIWKNNQICTDKVYFRFCNEDGSFTEPEPETPSFTNTETELTGEIALNYKNLDTSVGICTVMLYRWTDGWDFSSEKTKYLHESGYNSYTTVNKTAGTVKFSNAFMCHYGTGDYIAVLGGPGWANYATFKFHYTVTDNPFSKKLSMVSTTLAEGVMSFNFRCQNTESKDWVAIYPKDFTDKYKYYDYVMCGSLNKLTFPSGQPVRYTIDTNWIPLPEGEYVAVLYENNTYVEVHRLEFQVVKDLVEKGLMLSSTAYAVGDNINITTTNFSEQDKDFIRIINNDTSDCVYDSSKDGVKTLYTVSSAGWTKGNYSVYGYTGGTINNVIAIEDFTLKGEDDKMVTLPKKVWFTNEELVINTKNWSANDKDFLRIYKLPITQGYNSGFLYQTYGDYGKPKYTVPIDSWEEGDYCLIAWDHGDYSLPQVAYIEFRIEVASEVEGDDNYTNDGSIITILNNCRMDLTNCKHKELDGKLFNGWKTLDGDVIPNNTMLAKGTVLQATYVDIVNDGEKNDFAIRETEIRTDGKLGLRFIVEKSNALCEAVDIVDYGTLALPAEILNGTEDDRNWKDLEYGAVYTYNDKEYPAADIVGWKTYLSLPDRMYFSCCLQGITDENFDTQYAVRAYMHYRDLNGIEHVYYTDYISANPYMTARMALEGDSEIGENSKKVLKNLVDTVEAAHEDMYDSMTRMDVRGTSADPNTWIYQLGVGGLMVREVEIDSGKGGEPLTIAQMTDAHFNYMNASDLAERNPTLLSTYQNRTWLAKGQSSFNIRKVMDYAMTADRVVVTGDAIDYLSKGCIELLYKEIWDRCPTAIVTVGNHDYLQQMQGNVPESIPASERWKMLQDSWKHDIYYYSEVMNDKVMLIQLNNGERKFYESQIEPLENDLKLAREKGYTVLLFCHETIITNNPAMASVNAIRGNDMSGATNQNFYTNESRDHVGGNDADEATKAVCNLIYGNGDIIKGVFNGHYHSDFYTEILGTSPSGGTYMIPQYTLTGSAYDSGHVLKITVK